jgi:hypothetical protein
MSTASGLIKDIGRQSSQASQMKANERDHAEADYDKGTTGHFKFGAAGHGGVVGHMAQMEDLQQLTFACEGAYDAAQLSARVLQNTAELLAGNDAPPELDAEVKTLEMAPALYSSRMAQLGMAYAEAAGRSAELSSERDQADAAMADAPAQRP